MQARVFAGSEDSLSYLTPTGYGRSSCGYCKSSKRASVGAVSSSLRPSHYQILVDRGWRRSGTYYYKPDNAHSCCPHYTIRLDATAFASRRDQRQATSRWSKYIFGTDYVHLAARFCPRTREEKKRRRNLFDVCRAVHESEYSRVKRPVDTRTKEPIEPAHKFEVTLEPDKFTEEKYKLFENYQRFVHHEAPNQISRSSFRRFLCSGLECSTLWEDGKEKRIGSYHQCYRLDGKLVAMGVLDLLPHCVSSVYLIYHENVNDWNFGKLSALREIAMAVEGGYRYYYMGKESPLPYSPAFDFTIGYYIRSCIKMRYKATFRPQYVLDPMTDEWDPLDAELLEHLSNRKWTSMAIERYLKSPSFQQKLDMGPVRYKFALDYMNGSDESGDFDKPRGETNVFQAGMPGAMTITEIQETMNLGHWKLMIGDRIVLLEDLVMWDEGDISEPGTLKCLAAELAACIGPKLVAETILRLD